MMCLLATLILVVASVCASPGNDTRRMVLQNPNLFQGDILGIDPDDRNVIPYTQRRWTNGQIPFVIDISLILHYKVIFTAMAEFHKYTCLRFVPRTNEKNYIRLKTGEGCASYVGMLDKGEQVVELAEDGCLYKGTILHELGHAIGLFHEHNRSDRNDYLHVYYYNIKSGEEDQFNRLAPNENMLLTRFDHNSIMIYGNYAFSKDGRSPTMESKQGYTLYDAFDKNGMTKLDIYKVNKMYGCI